MEVAVSGVEGGRRPAPADPLRAIFAEWGVARTLRRGERLHLAGEPLAHVYLIRHGWISRTRTVGANEAAFTGVHMAGDVVAADGMLNDTVDDDLHALTDGAVLRLPAAHLLKSALRDDGATAALLGLLAADARFLREGLVAVGRLSSTERVAVFILQTLSRQAAMGLIAPDARRFDLPLTQAQLAGVTGMTPVHLNRVLRTLRGKGCLELASGVVRVDDMEGLEREAGRAA